MFDDALEIYLDREPDGFPNQINRFTEIVELEMKQLFNTGALFVFSANAAAN
jgi:hypothetical protein